MAKQTTSASKYLILCSFFFRGQRNIKIFDPSRFAFDTFDANHDGSIDFDEFHLAISATSQGDIDDRLSVAFDMYDISNDGQIDQKELTKLITAMVHIEI